MWKIWTCWRHLSSQAILSGCGAFKSNRKTRLCEKNENAFTLNSHYVYLYILTVMYQLHCERNLTPEIRRKTSCLTAVDASRPLTRPQPLWLVDMRQGSARGDGKDESSALALPYHTRQLTREAENESVATQKEWNDSFVLITLVIQAKHALTYRSFN